MIKPLTVTLMLIVRRIATRIFMHQLKCGPGLSSWRSFTGRLDGTRFLPSGFDGRPVDDGVDDVAGYLAVSACLVWVAAPMSGRSSLGRGARRFNPMADNDMNSPFVPRRK